MIYAMWHGGDSYSHGELDRDLEVFTSAKAAGWALQDRYNSNGVRHMTFIYADGRQEATLLPAVNESTSMECYKYDPRGIRDPYPDFRLTLGPRGGVKRENY